jgi:hypothetical protein
MLQSCQQWITLSDTHWDILNSFHAAVAYDILAYPLELARWFAASCLG